METVLALFARTPGCSPIKTRLASTLGPSAAERCYVLCVHAMRDTVEDVHADILWALAEEEGPDHEFWTGYETRWTGPGTLGERQNRIYSSLLSRYTRVLLAGTDTPQLTEQLFERARSSLESNPFVLGPATDGGYYLFGGTEHLPENTWTSISWNREDTGRQLKQNLPSTPSLLPERTDIDREEDLSAVMEEMPDSPSQPGEKWMHWRTNL